MNRLKDNKSTTVTNYNANHKIKSNGVNTSLDALIHNIDLENSDIQNDTQESIELGITIFNASAKWTDAQPNYCIQNINLNVRPGQLVAVIGPVGAGKVYIKSRILKK